MRKVVIGFGVLFGGLVVLLGAAFLLREDLVRYGAGRFFSDGQLTLTRLEGLELTSTQLRAAELEFLFNESGQRLAIAGLAVQFRITSFSTAPAVDAITIDSARLSEAPADSAMQIGAETSADDSTTRLSSVLTLLREFPLARIEVGSLVLPQRSQPLALHLQRGEGRLDARAESGALLLEAQFTQASPAAAAHLDISLTRDATTVGDFTLTLQPMGEVFALAGSGMLDIADLNTLLGELEQAPLALPLRAARLEWTLAGNVADDLSGSSGDSRAQTFNAGLQKASTLTLPAGLAEGLGEVVVELTDGAEFVVTSGAGLTLSSERVPLHLASSWKEQSARVEAVLSLAECELAASAACVLGFDGSANLGEYGVAGVIEVTAADGNYQVNTQGLILSGLPELVPAFDIDARVAVSDERIAFSTPLLMRSTSTDAGIALDGTYERATSRANLHLVLPELTFMEGGALSTWFPDWPYTFDVLAGSMAADLALQWQDGAFTGTLDGSLNELGGFYGDYFFRGVNGRLQASIDQTGVMPLSIQPTTLTIAGLDVGLPLEDIELAFSLESAGILHIDSVMARVLEGTLSGKDITYDINRERNDVLVSFSGLRMERMLDLVDYEGVEAIGAVSGEVPLTITPNGVEVAAGILTADAPGGSIRYLAAAAGATGNAGLDLVNQSLGNYQFESLTSDIDYKPDGELVLAMKLQGHNPDMQGGQRINLNLNLSDNIPALLESLQAARKLEDFLAEQYE